MSDRTDDQLKELAKDYVAGKVFTDKDIASSDYRSLMPMVFLPIGLLNREQIESYAKDPPALLYEYTSKRLLRTINGYPQFMSCYSMNQGEVDRFIVFVQKVKEALDSV